MKQKGEREEKKKEWGTLEREGEEMNVKERKCKQEQQNLKRVRSKIKREKAKPSTQEIYRGWESTFET